MLPKVSACLHSQAHELEFPFWIHGVKCDVSPAFAATPASVLLGRFSTRFRNVFMGIFRPFFEMCICEDRHWCWTWLAVSALSGWDQDSSVSLFYNKLTDVSMDRTILELLKRIPQSWEHETVWSGEALRVAFNVKRSWTPQTPPTSIARLTNFTIGKCSQANIVLLHRTASKVWFSTQLMLYTRWYKLGCRYSAMETNYMKVLDTVLQLSEGRRSVVTDSLVISAPADPTLWFYVASTLWLSFCDF